MRFTGDTWAKLIREEKNIPESFAGFFQKIYTPQTPFPYTVFAPPDKWYRRKVNPKLICLFDNRIYIAEKIKKQIVSRCFIFHHIHFIEMGTILLHSWLKINGTADGELTSITVEFNTVVEALFKAITEKIRTSIHGLEKVDNSEIQLQRERQKFNFLDKENFKFMNFSKRCLLPGTEVCQILFQPDIQVKFWRYFYRMISLAHQVILTDKELILIKDDERLNRTHPIRYGGIWCYIPLKKISKLDVTTDLKGHSYGLTIYLPENVTLNALFSADRKPQLDLLKSNFERLRIYPDEMKKSSQGI